MANSEDIEARLCAYIEGDMDAAQRAEIERHLAAHPQHQKMITDLIATRDLLSGLPRVKAPSDLSEGLQGQLERSMLLGDGLEGSLGGKPRRGRWRIAAHQAVMAAVLLLAVGLGSVVTLVIRAGSQSAAVALIPPVAAPEPVAAPVVQQVQPLQDVAPATQPAEVVAVSAAATQPVIAAVVAADTQPAVVVADAGATTQPVLAVAATQPSGVADVWDGLVAPGTQPAVVEGDDAGVDPLLAIPAAVVQGPATRPVLVAPAVVVPTTGPVGEDPAGQ
jgi:hypothetical protein